jgi:cell division septum initiation protein DivIVA
MFEDLASLLRENRRLQAHLEAMTQQLNRLREANTALRQKLIEQNRLLKEQLSAVEREIAHIQRRECSPPRSLGARAGARSATTEQ